MILFMRTADSVTQRPTVSVIVPARNEEACLGTCLKSLVGQSGIDFEIIVVDDGSTDRTREIAESFVSEPDCPHPPKVILLNAPPLPPGWSGKNNALVAGAAEARGSWLLFTDADTVHPPGSLARSVAEARQHGAVLLSYSPEQEVHGFWEKAVMPVIFAELAATYRPSLVSDHASPAAAANGQYLLISRDAYGAVGGHAAIAENLLEDVALARAVKASGRRIFFRYGGDAVRTRMYRGLAHLIEGWTKNLALLFPSPLRLALLRLLEFLLIVGSCAVAITEGIRGRSGAALISGSLAVILAALFLKRIRRAHFSWDANALSLVGLPLFSFLLLRSTWSQETGTMSWKGRHYARSGEGGVDPATPQGGPAVFPVRHLPAKSGKGKEISSQPRLASKEWACELGGLVVWSQRRLSR